MVQKSAQNSHGFFFVVMFMALVVVGTVVTYFVFLPKSAPKQITLAVLPFSGSASVPEWLKYGLAADIRNELALSRDVKVIDFQSSVDAFDEGYNFESITDELGASHFVDGNFDELNSDLSGTLSVRLVNATHAAWKEVWTSAISVKAGEWEQLRASVARTIRDELYDLNTPRELGLVNDANSYLTYLRALHAFHHRADKRALAILNEIPESGIAPYMELLKRHLSTRQDGIFYFEMREMFEATEAQYRLDELNTTLRASQDLREYKEQLENLVADYPNSTAVSILADLYLYAGWLRQSEQLLIRWAQLRPRSFNVGVRLAHIDYLRNDIPGAMRALEIAGERSKNIDGAEIMRSTLQKTIELERESPSIYELREVFIENNPGVDLPKTPLPDIYEEFDCDSKIALTIARERLQHTLEALHCAQHTWVTPPFFTRITDPRWEALTSTDEYQAYLEREGYARPNLSDTGPTNVDALFVPRRD